MLTDLKDETTPWLTRGQAERAEKILRDQGLDLSIREPEEGETAGIYLRQYDGSLRKFGRSNPRPEILKIMIDRAVEA